jgi:hypothetical protein
MVVQDRRSASTLGKAAKRITLQAKNSLPKNEARWRDDIAAKRLSDSEQAQFNEAYHDRRHRPTLPSHHYRFG